MTRRRWRARSASLIGGAVEGVVREVIVCDRGSTDQTHYVAEHAGCHFIADGGIAAGIAQGQGRLAALLEPGARLLDGWIEPVVAHIGEVDDAGALLARPRASGCRSWRACFRPTARLPQGLVIAKRQAAVAGQERRQRRSAGARAGDEAARCRDRRRRRAEDGVAQALLPPRFRCSSSRGMISTKLQGMWR